MIKHIFLDTVYFAEQPFSIHKMKIKVDLLKAEPSKKSKGAETKGNKQTITDIKGISHKRRQKKQLPVAKMIKSL